MKKSFLFFFGIVLSCFTYAQVQVSQPKETEYGDRRHRATIRMESATLCPGQEVELGIYVDLLLGQSGGGSGSYTPEQLPPDPLDNFMFYFYISDTSAAEVVCSSTEHRSPTYRVGYPVLSDKMPELAGGSLTCGYIEGFDDGLGKRGRFTCIWVRNRPSVQLIPTIERPLFKIRVRLKKAVPVTISIDDPNEIAFSTGLAQMGGYYYSFYNVPGGIPNRVPGKLTVDKGPDKATVSAGRDSVVCIGSRVFFNAEGGKSYRWSQCYNPGISGGYNYEHLSNVNTKNPTFYPLHSGPYIYQVEAFDERGCSTRDTVVYYVQQNYLKAISVDPNNTLVDSGSRVKFTLNGTANPGAWGRLKVILEPDTLFPSGGNIVRAEDIAGYDPSAGLMVNGSLFTKPVYEPTLITATLQDTACSIQTSASICINGVGVTGKIAPFPVYRCGEDRQRKSLQLNLLTHGGSNNFLYNWRATDLEFTQFPGAAPKIDNPNLRSPNITYYGRFAVSVDIYDMMTGETVTISDTVIKRDWLTAETKVVLDTLSLMEAGLNVDGPYCDGTVLTYKAQSVNAGKDAKYLWQVNGVWKEEGINDTVFSADLYKGDSVQCVLYSTEACVRNMAAESKPFSPDIRRPVTPTIEIVNRDPDGFDFCGIELQAVCHEVGKLFRLQWLRNGEVEVDTLVRAQNPDYDTVNVSFERKGFYDGFTCMLTETDMPCGDMDTVFATVSTENMVPSDISDIQTYSPLVASDVLPTVGAVQMDASLVCSTDPFTLTAQVENLTEQFELRWYRKAADDSVLLGFYRYPYATTDVDYSLLGAHAGYGYNQGQSNTDILPAFKDGFKIILNDPDAAVNERRTFAAGDTVFYVLSAEYEGYFCNPVDPQTLVLRSPYFVPSIMEPAEAPALVVDYVEKTSLCPGTGHAYHLAASMESEADYRLDWTFMDLSVTDPEIAGYFNLSGQRNDTLESRLVIKPGIIAGTWGNCTATITEGCHAGHKQTVAFNLNNHVLNTPGFRIRHSEDTIVCADMPVQHHAQVVELSDVSATSQAEPLPQTSGSYEICWARSLQNLISGTPEATGNTFNYTPVPNGNTPNGSGDFEDNRGIFTTYIKAKETSSGCEVIDSVLVMVAHPYQVKARIDYLLSDTWCDSSDYAATDPTRLVEGFPFRVGGQYALLRIENGGAKPTIEWGLNDEVYRDMPYDTLDMAGAPDGDTLKAWVTTSMYTCLSEKAAAAPKLIRLARRGDLYTHGPESAIAGNEVLLQAYVGEHKHSIAGIDGYNFTYSMQMPDGGWQPIGTNLSENRNGWLDTMRAQMPAYTGQFRVESRDKYNVCPAQTEDIDVTLAVETGITMRLFDPATKREIKGLCPQSYGFVYADGQSAPQNAQAVWVNNTREPMDVLVRTYPQNPTGKAFVVYYKNGALSAVGPVGTEPLPFDPKDGFGDCRVLQRGDTITGRILPGEWFGAMYVHDTVSIDGNSIHHTAQFRLEAIDTTGSLVVSATPKAVCAGDEVQLSAAFEKGEASVSWLPENGVTVTGGHTATATPRQTSVYTAVGRDANGCWWKDSVKVNMADNSQSISINLKADSLLFCGEKVQMGVWMDSAATPTEYFSKYYWYEINANGNRLIDSTTEAYLTYWASNGARLMMQAHSTLSCQEGLSQSDTLVFGGFAYPQLKRLSPVAADTTVCPRSEVRIAYRVEPADALMQWYGELDGYSEYIEEATDHFDFVADENARFTVTAKNADMPVCATVDTVKVWISGSGETLPQIALNADKTVVCGAEEVTYTATASNYDRILWFANGQLLNETATTLVRVPRITGFEAPVDSVFAWALRSEVGGCISADTAKAQPVLVWRVEKPVLHLACADTSVNENSPVLLQASATVFDGPAADVIWYDANGNEAASGSGAASYQVTHKTKGEYLHYVQAIQSDLEEDLPECYSYDSVRIIVGKVAVEEQDETLVLVTPNPNSGRFTVQTSVPCNIEIFSLSGSRVWFRENALGRIPVTLQVSGVYFVRAMESAGGRFVIEKLVVR